MQRRLRFADLHLRGGEAQLACPVGFPPAPSSLASKLLNTSSGGTVRPPSFFCSRNRGEARRAASQSSGIGAGGPPLGEAASAGSDSMVSKRVLVVPAIFSSGDF